MKLEVCANSATSALVAAEAGAHRVELCAALELGGLTPSHATLEHMTEQLRIPARVLIRPRPGHFTYSESELRTMVRDIVFVRSLGVEGVVIGALKHDLTLDKQSLSRMIEAAGSMALTFHRAIDCVLHPEKAIEELIGLGFDTILSSGQAQRAVDGLDTLKGWQQEFGKRIDLMPGAGVAPEQIAKFQKAGFGWVHASASAKNDNPIPNKRSSMNTIGISDTFYSTQSDQVSALLVAMKVH